MNKQYFVVETGKEIKIDRIEWADCEICGLDSFIVDTDGNWYHSFEIKDQNGDSVDPDDFYTGNR